MQNAAPGNGAVRQEAVADGVPAAAVDGVPREDGVNNEGLRRRRGEAADQEPYVANRNVNEVRENGSDHGRVAAQGGQEEIVRRPISFLKLCYLVVTDFLASLVPE